MKSLIEQGKLLILSVGTKASNRAAEWLINAAKI
jgi:hypothetical protein